MEEEARIKPDMLRLSRELELPLVATNDVHYVRQSDAAAHDVLLAIQTATSINDENRMRFPNDEFYLKSEEEMRRIFASTPEAIDNTQLIADACNVEFQFGQYHLPEFKAPAGKSNEQYLRELCDRGLAERYGEQADESLRQRLEYEIGTHRFHGLRGILPHRLGFYQLRQGKTASWSDRAAARRPARWSLTV